MGDTGCELRGHVTLFVPRLCRHLDAGDERLVAQLAREERPERAVLAREGGVGEDVGRAARPAVAGGDPRLRGDDHPDAAVGHRAHGGAERGETRWRKVSAA